MRTVSPRVRKQVEAQGFLGLEDSLIAEIAPWLRLAPAICMTWAAVGVVLGSPLVFWALVPFAALGAILPGSPFDVIYNHGFRHVLGTRPIPRYGTPRRSACAVASVWLTLTGAAFAAGWLVPAYLLGAGMVLTPGVQVFTGFCVPSLVFGLLFGKPGRGASAATGVVDARDGGEGSYRDATA